MAEAEISKLFSGKINESSCFELLTQDEKNLPLSCKDLGEPTGIPTESVIRIMKNFKDDGIIEMSGKSISLLDVNRLEKISEIA